MDIWKYDKWKNTIDINYPHYRNGLRLNFQKGVNKEVKRSCIEFVKWLRKQYFFPIRVPIYLKKSEYVKTQSGELVSAKILVPLDKNMEPYITIATGDIIEELKKGKCNTLAGGVLGSIIHELTHYFQWINDIKLTDKQAEIQANYYRKKIIREYALTQGLISKNESSLIKKADRLLDNEKYEEAIQCYNKVIELNSGIDSVYSNMGSAYDNLEQFEEAIKSYDRAINLAPLDWDLYVKKAYSLDCLHKYDEAILLYEKAIKLNPRERIIFNNMGYSLLCLEKYNESIISFNKAIELDASDEGTYVYKANALESLSKYEDSLLCLDKAIELNPKYSIAYNHKGHVLFEQGKYKEAIQNFNKAIKIDSEYAEPYYYKAIVLITLNKIDESLKSLKKAIELDEEYKKHTLDESYFDEIKNNSKFVEIMK